MSRAPPMIRTLLLLRPAAGTPGRSLRAPPLLPRACIGTLTPLSAAHRLPLRSRAILAFPAPRGLHWSCAVLRAPQIPDARESAPAAQPSTDVEVKLPMYDMPMWRQVRNLRFIFLVNVFCSTAVSLWVRGDDIYTVLVACAMMAAGFIPLAFVQLMYFNHVKSIRILGTLGKRALSKARRAERAGTSQIEFPVSKDTPLLVTKFSLTGRDPQTPLFVRDLVPGPERKYSVQWLYRSPSGVQRFRVSKKVIQYHPDVRALDALIRKNASLAARPT